MKTKNFFYLLLLPLFTLAMASCQDEEEDINQPETPQEDEVVNTIVRPKIALRQTDDGYAPVVEPISAETFFQYFSKGGWNQSADYRVSPEGVVSGPYSVVGGCSTVLQYVSTTSLNDITSGIGPSGETRVASELYACEYDEQTNTLTYGSRQFTVLSIADEEIRCTMPLDVGDYQLMSYSNVEPWVLKYIIFRHISEETMGMILSHGS